MKIILFTFAVLLIVGLVRSLTIKIDAHKEECFYEDIEAPNAKILVQFQVSAGGFLDIDLSLYDPDGALIHLVERETEGKYTFNARIAGIHKFCFSNKMSTLTAKTVSFTISVGDVLDPNLAKLEHLDPIEKSIMRLSEGLTSIQTEQNYLRTRERVHRDTSESTNSRVLWWSIFEVFVLVAMSVWQVYYLKRFFEIKRQI